MVLRGIYRCNVCNKCSSAEVSGDDDTVFASSFYPDPAGGLAGGYICGECYSEYKDVQYGYELQDQENGVYDYPEEPDGLEFLIEEESYDT